MKKYVASIILIVLFLGIFIPLASNDPDGLERVVEAFGVEETQSFWNGVFADYFIGIIRNPYVSTLGAGIVGVILVLTASLLLGVAISPKERANLNKE